MATATKALPRKMPVVMSVADAQLLASYAAEAIENKTEWMKHGEAQHYTTEERTNIVAEMHRALKLVATISAMKA
jgi:hypothetical protein